MAKNCVRFIVTSLGLAVSQSASRCFSLPGLYSHGATGPWPELTQHSVRVEEDTVLSMVLRVQANCRPQHPAEAWRKLYWVQLSGPSSVLTPPRKRLRVVSARACALKFLFHVLFSRAVTEFWELVGLKALASLTLLCSKGQTFFQWVGEGSWFQRSVNHDETRRRLMGR